jgi:hypothetical protein
MIYMNGLKTPDMLAILDLFYTIEKETPARRTWMDSWIYLKISLLRVWLGPLTRK